jgi:hypothetical protein
MTMKRNSLVLGLVLAGLALSATQASAFFCHKPWRFRCHRYATHITCRPYNAFTPICWGNLVCDGCCPNPCGVAAGCLPFNYMGGWPAFAGTMGGCAAPVLGVPPTAPAAPGTFTPPPPAPATNSYYPGAYNPYAFNPYVNPYGVMRVGYHPAYPGYYYNPYAYAGYNPLAYGAYYTAAYGAYNPAAYAAYYQTLQNWYNGR